MASSSYSAMLDGTVGRSCAIGCAYCGSVIMELANIAGLDVSPAIPSWWIRRVRLPSCSMWRLMSSSQALTPSLRNSSSGLGTGVFMQALLRESNAAGSASLAVSVRICVNQGPCFDGEEHRHD